MVKWFDVLKKNNIEIKLSEMPEEETVVAGDAIKEEPVPEEIPKKKTTRKKKNE